MKRNNKNCLIFLFLLFFILFFLPKSFANESINFLSLKKNEVNLRQGPSFEYPIKLIYNKKYLPLIILDKSGPWRKIKDFENKIKKSKNKKIKQFLLFLFIAITIRALI